MNIVPEPPASPVYEQRKQQRQRKHMVRMASMALVGLLLFSSGWALGRGNLRLSATQPTTGSNKSISSSGTLPEDLDYASVEKVYDTLRENFDGELDESKLLDGLKEGLARAADDPYTEFFTTEKEQEFSDDLNGKFSGIGAELTRENELIIVQSPISGAPAEKAGIRARDAIIEVDGESAINWTVEQAVKKIRGESGTEVKLVVVRGGSERLEFTITRAEITIPSVEHKILDGNLGYLKISRFAKDTGDLATKAANEFKQKGVTGIVLDLRNDPGGYLDAAVEVSGLWLPRGQTVVDERKGDKVVRTYYSAGPGVLKGIPTAVLLNEGSASASEITAGALRDSAEAILVGKKSFGKGVVQEVLELGKTTLLSGQDSADGALKVTVAKWFTPKGANIHKEGLKPDIEVDLTVDDAKAARDPQLDRAVDRLKTCQ